MGDPSMQAHRGAGLAGFAERLLAVIDEGRRVATYKLALLMALTECCAEAGTVPGDAPLTLSTRSVADGVTRLYWRQLRPFPASTGAIDLRQITNKSAAVLRALASLRLEVPMTSSWEAAKAGLPELATRVLDRVELTVARYPILRLQVIDGVSQPFIYDVDWSENVTLTQLHNMGDHAILFRAGAPDQLVRLAPLVRPLVETHWVRMVAELNRIAPEEDSLRRHLFGSERSTFPPALRHGLSTLQARACFYCGEPLELDGSAVDHFIPWTRWPNDAIENLVLAHSPCNGHKSSRVPGPVPLSHWVDRFRLHRPDLRRLAVEAKWSSAPDRTLSVATSLYAHLPDGAPLWNGPGEIVTSSSTQLMDILHGAS